MSYKIKKTLVNWATGDTGRITQITIAQDLCAAKMLANLGSQLVNANTNGNSFGVKIDMTFDEYFVFLGDVLAHITNGTTPTNRSVGGFTHG